MVCIIYDCQNESFDDDELCNAHLTLWKCKNLINPANLQASIKIKSRNNYTNLICLPKSCQEFLKIQNKFLSDWVKKNATDVRVEAIYNIYLSPNIYQKYKSYRDSIESNHSFSSKGLSPGNEKLLYHGTDHDCCTMFNDNTTSLLCKMDECAGCGILINSFDIKRVGLNKQGRTPQRLGQGIYFTPYSSKAHFYGHRCARPLPNDQKRKTRIMFLSKVVIGNTWQPDKVSHDLTKPPSGYNSTWGRQGYCPLNNSLSPLVFEEYAVYWLIYSYLTTTE
ncbi:13541_t:CDS:2 [Entrophospora sp. SA101]|nr:13541_t:CDS:2 [Entrophospora sp. SA101]